MHRELQAQGDSRQRVVAVQHHVIRIELRHGIESVARNVLAASLRQGAALVAHTFFDCGGKARAGFEKQSFFVEVAECVLGLEVQRKLGAGCMALQGLFDARKQIVAADQKLYRVVEHVEDVAQGVFQSPGERDHALGGDFHRRIVVV